MYAVIIMSEWLPWLEELFCPLWVISNKVNIGLPSLSQDMKVWCAVTFQMSLKMSLCYWYLNGGQQYDICRGFKTHNAPWWLYILILSLLFTPVTCQPFVCQSSSPWDCQSAKLLMLKVQWCHVILLSQCNTHLSVQELWYSIGVYWFQNIQNIYHSAWIAVTCH